LSRLTSVIAISIAVFLTASCASAQRYNRPFAPLGLVLGPLPPAPVTAFNFDTFVDDPLTTAFFYDDQSANNSKAGCHSAQTVFEPLCGDHLVAGGHGGTGGYSLTPGAPTLWRNRGLSFTDKAWHDFTSAGGNNAFTIAFHLQATNSLGALGYFLDSTILRKETEFFVGSTDLAFELCMDVGNAYPPTGCGLGSGTGPTTGTGPIADLLMHHFAAVYDTGTCSLFVDGLPVGTPDTACGTIINSSNSFFIGYPSNALAEAAYVLDNLQIYDYALTQAQVDRIKNYNVPDK